MTNSSSDRSDSCSNFFMLEIDAALRDIKATEDILERPKLETCFPFGNFFGRLEFVFNERASCQVSFSRQGTVRIEIMWICIFRRESGQRRMSISCSMLSPLPFPSLASCTKAKNSLGRFFPLCHIFKSHMWVRERERAIESREQQQQQSIFFFSCFLASTRLHAREVLFLRLSPVCLSVCLAMSLFAKLLRSRAACHMHRSFQDVRLSCFLM